MSLHATPILYLNLGGEMLYVLRQRLKAQRIDAGKTIQVLDDVTTALLNPKVLCTVFKETPLIDMTSLRSTLEFVVLSSIMRLDSESMNKLFDLMIMMVKYQLTVASGPREIILLTLNHTDAMRDMVSDPNAQECVGLVHQMIVDFYSNLTYEEVWKARNECLQTLEPYCVRVSILLRLGIQNEDATFNFLPQKYNERYYERKDTLNGLKITYAGGEQKCDGTFNLFGDRGTLLGRNMYSPSYGSTTKLKPKRSNEHFLKDCGTKAELGMLAIQLGTEEMCQRPFTLNLFSNEDDETTNVNTDDCNANKSRTSAVEEETEARVNEEYKNKMDNIHADFSEDEHVELKRKMDLLELLDEVQ